MEECTCPFTVVVTRSPPAIAGSLVDTTEPPAKITRKIYGWSPRKRQVPCKARSSYIIGVDRVPLRAVLLSLAGCRRFGLLRSSANVKASRSKSVHNAISTSSCPFPASAKRHKGCLMSLAPFPNAFHCVGDFSRAKSRCSSGSIRK